MLSRRLAVLMAATGMAVMVLALAGMALAAQPTGSVGGGSGGSDVNCVHQKADGTNICPRGSGGHDMDSGASGGGGGLVVTNEEGQPQEAAGGNGGLGDEGGTGAGYHCTIKPDGNLDECQGRGWNE